MEWKDTPVIVLSLILVGIIVGVGVLTLDKFNTAVRETDTLVNESFTQLGATETITLAKGENVTGITQIVNASNVVWHSSNYTLNTATGVFTINDNVSICYDGRTCYVTYTYYEYGTDAGSSAWNSRDAVGDVSNTWLSLIVTMIALALIIGLVIRGFAVRER